MLWNLPLPAHPEAYDVNDDKKHRAMGRAAESEAEVARQV